MFSKGSPLSSSIQSFPRLLFGPIFSKIQKFCISNLHNLKNNCFSDQEMILQISKVKKNFETGFLSLVTGGFSDIETMKMPFETS